jgi:hypothetical protein
MSREPKKAMDADFNYFEKFVAQKVKQVKPKSKQRGYAKKLVAKMFTVIEESLNQGCDYDDIAVAISETNVKISPSTLKRYHLSNRKNFEQDNLPQPQKSIEAENTQVNKSTDHELEPINLVDKLKLSNSSSQILSGSSLTDDDYLDDFNNY